MCVCVGLDVWVWVFCFICDLNVLNGAVNMRCYQYVIMVRVINVCVRVRVKDLQCFLRLLLSYTVFMISY